MPLVIVHIYITYLYETIGSFVTFPLSTLFVGLWIALCRCRWLSEITWHIAHGNSAYSCILKVCTKTNEIKVYFLSERKFVYASKRFSFVVFFSSIEKKKSIENLSFYYEFFFFLYKNHLPRYVGPTFKYIKKKYSIHPSTHHITTSLS